MLKKIVMVVALTLGVSFNANALLIKAINYLDYAIQYASAAHQYASYAFVYDNAGYSSLGLSYATYSRDSAHNAYMEAYDSYQNNSTPGAYYAQFYAYYAYASTNSLVQYWNSNPVTAINYAALSDVYGPYALAFASTEYALSLVVFGSAY